MLVMPRGTPRKSKARYKIGELKHYESLEAKFKCDEAKKAAKMDEIERLQVELDKRIRYAIRAYSEPEMTAFEPIDKYDTKVSIRLRKFQEERNAVSSPRWENELKGKYDEPS